MVKLRERGGTRKVNGRARRTVEALEAAGLVDVDWNLHIEFTGRSHWRITVKEKKDA